MNSCVPFLFQESDYHVPVLSMKECAKHNQRKNAWIIIQGIVYSLQKDDEELLEFFQDHYGKDVSIYVKEIMNNKEIILLLEKLKSRKIGKILH